MERAIVTNIQGYSIHDGPGIRTVVFIKGCPLRCRWCANPENLTPKPEVGFVSKLCQNCGRCVGACPKGAIIAGQDRYRIDRKRCGSCGACVESCYYDALVSYGSEKSAEEVFNAVRKDKVFYDQSGGGVTVSGGEPLTKPKFVRELFAMCKEAGINTCIETCGHVSCNAFEMVLPYTDQFYFDLKVMDPDLHEEYTGVHNSLILENAAFLTSHKASILFRQPIIPGVNATEKNVLATAAFIRSLGNGHPDIQLMPYHRIGQSKYDALDLAYGMGKTPVPDSELVNKLCSLYLAEGVNCTVSK